jgi:hypothetical protein
MTTAALLVCLVGAAVLLVAATAQPAPPLWDKAFKFVASVDSPPPTTTVSMQYHYRWDLPAVAQVLTNQLGQTFVILNVKTNTWRVTPGNRTCCLCTNPNACGHVTPPAPDWLRSGNTTRYLGVTTINERDCHGWAKTSPVAEFGWWTSVATGQPCQLAWLLGATINMVMSSYTNDPSLVPDSTFDVPPYCPYHETDPNCNISSF